MTDFKATCDLSGEQLAQVVDLDQRLMPFCWSMELWKQESLESSSYIALLQKSKRLVGFALYRLWDSFSQADLLKITVDLPFQGSGLAEQLWLDSIGQLKKKGATSLHLQVQFHNKRAIAWYKKMGTMELDLAHNYYSNGDDALIMAKEL